MGAVVAYLIILHSVFVTDEFWLKSNNRGVKKMSISVCTLVEDLDLNRFPKNGISIKKGTP